MMRKGEWFNNVVAESSFFGSLQIEILYHKDYRARVHARQCIFEYIVVLYKRYRRHEFFNYMAPAEYAAKSFC